MLYSFRSLRYFEKSVSRSNIHLKSQHNKDQRQEINLEKRKAELMAKGLPKVKPINNVKHIVVIASGKGGVGKSATAVNLAAAVKMVAPEKNIGLLDADIFGPSLPLMMNLHDKPLTNKEKRLLPLTNYGVKCMSMGFLIEEGSPVIWRGLMVMQALGTLMRGVEWGPIDYLFIDTPPGTGDTHLSLVQNLPISGVILVSTPQNAALQVAKRGAAMFKKLSVPLIGLVENMSSIQCPKCSNEVRLFGTGTDLLAQDIGVPILQKIPLESDIATCGDRGLPLVIKDSDSHLSGLYKTLAKSVIQFLENK